MDERDPDYIRDQLPGLWLLASVYFRAQVRHLERIPATGPVLLVGNHSGGNMTPDTLVFTLAFSAYFGVERRFHQLAHNLVLLAPGLGVLRKFGTIAASPENAHQVLSSGAVLLVYPGGDIEVHRPSSDRFKVDFGGRKGFLQLALDENVPLVPVVSVGGQETALFLSRGEWLAKFLGLDRLARLKVLPISLALPWGVNVGDFLGHIPLPAKITVDVLEPIDLRAEYRRASGSRRRLQGRGGKDASGAGRPRRRTSATGHRLMRVAQKLVIEAPRATIWEVISDGKRYPDFMADAELWDVVGDQASGLGARWAIRLRVGSAPVGGLVEVTEFDVPANLAFNAITGVATRGRWRLRERRPGLTEVEFRLNYQSPGGLLGLVADRVSGPLVARILKRSLRNLRDLLEGPG